VVGLLDQLIQEQQKLWNGTSHGLIKSNIGLATARGSIIRGEGTQSGRISNWRRLLVLLSVANTEEWNYGVVVPVAGSFSSGGKYE
jgi:hypothetical protein